MVLKTMSSNDVKQKWGTVMSSASEPDHAVIIESHGKPRVAVIPFAEFQAFQAFKEQRRRQSLLHQLDELEATYGNRNEDLTDAQVTELADRFSRESVAELIAEGKIVLANAHE